MAKNLLHTKAEISETEESTGIIEAIVGSTSVVDRMGDIIEQEGWELKDFKKNPVILWGHNIREEKPPIGKALKVWLEGKGKKAKLMFKVQFDMKDEFAVEVFRKIKEGFLNTVSVGFLPTEWERMESDNPFGGYKYLKSQLLELSVVPVPANPQALVELRSAGMHPKKLEEMFAQKKVSSESKGELEFEEVKEDENIKVTKYKDLGTAPESESFDVPGEVAKADVKDLPELSAFYEEGSDKKSCYKLIHHKAESKEAVFRGVTLAMAHLMGAKGGVEISDVTRKKVYDHLAKHYKEFGKTAPSYNLVENQVLADLEEEVHALALDREDKHTVRLLKRVLSELKKNNDVQRVETSEDDVVTALSIINNALSTNLKK